MRSVNFSRRRRLNGAGTVEAVSHRIADPLRALQIPPAEDAAHGHGVDKVRVGRTLAVRTSLGHHLHRLAGLGFQTRALERKTKPRRDGSTPLTAPNTLFQRQMIGFFSVGANAGRTKQTRTNADPTNAGRLNRLYFPATIRSACCRWLMSCPANMRTMCSIVSWPRSACIP
jgi:hypothetical protein